jgi:hypothetical protein
MLTLEELDLFDDLYNDCGSMNEAISKFILIKSGCKTLELARKLVENDPDLLYLFKVLDDSL